jgi:type I restriction enzyme, S subunit
MKTTRLDLPVMASWMESNGRRLDGKPYLSGAFEAKEILKRLSVRKDTLQTLTKGGMQGIFIAPYFKRVYVNDREHGIPLLGNTDILMADISTASLLSRKVFEQYRSGLELKEGWTLITCFGTVGNIAYCHGEMTKCAGSTNFMRVVPDESKILPGYLYAYLSSKFGVTLVTEKETGSVIPNLLPNHIADLPVPRLGEAIESKIHNLIVEASELRTKSGRLLVDAIKEIELLSNLQPLSRTFEKNTPDISITSSEGLSLRMDALFHSKYHKSALSPLLKLSKERRITIGEISLYIFEPTRLKRIQLDDSMYGIPFFGTTALMWSDPIPSYYIPTKGGFSDQYIVDDKTVLIPRSGQLSGIIGQAVLPYGSLVGGAISEHAIRIIAESPNIAGYVFLALSSEYGKRQLKSRAYGKSIPTLDIKMVQQVIIPNLGRQEIERLGAIGCDISKSRSLAIQKETEAKKIIEEFIEKRGSS